MDDRHLRAIRNKATRRGVSIATGASFSPSSKYQRFTASILAGRLRGNGEGVDHPERIADTQNPTAADGRQEYQPSRTGHDGSTADGVFSGVSLKSLPASCWTNVSELGYDGRGSREKRPCPESHNVIEKIMSDCGCGTDQAERLERKTLVALLTINAVMFLAEIILGWLAESAGLIADSLDMLADAGVYGLSLYAVGKGIQKQSSAASISGTLQIILGVGVLVEVLRRFLFGSEPESFLMIGVGVAALVANISCLMLISRHRDSGVHMRASWIFSTNDVIANLGVIISGGLVWFFGSRYPDLVVGAIISAFVVRGGIKILNEVRHANEAHADA